MKKLRIIFALSILQLALFTAGCGSREQTVPKTLSENSQYWWTDQSSVQNGTDGYYLIKTVDRRIYYCDKESRQIVPLCNKAECSHEEGEEDCNAAFTGYTVLPLMLRQHGDKLYLIGSDMENNVSILQIALDGSGWDVLNVLWRKESENDGGVTVFLTDNGYGYYKWHQISEDGETEVWGISRVALQKDAKPEELFRGENVNYLSMSIYDGYLYYIKRSYDEKAVPIQMCRYSFDAREEEVLIPEGTMGSYGFLDQIMYYTDENPGVWKMDLKTGEKELFLDGEEGILPLERVFCDGESVCVLNTRQVRAEGGDKGLCRIYNTEGKLTGSVEIGVDEYMVVYGGDEDCLVIQGMLDEKFYWKKD